MGLVDEVFGEDVENMGDDFYPGSRRRRRDQPIVEREEPPPEFWREDYTEKIVNGEVMRLYTIGALAAALSVSVPSIRLWIKKGFLPESPYRLPSNMIAKGENVAGRRLYPEAVIDATVEVFSKYGMLNRPRIPWADYPEMPIEIYDRWQDVLREMNNNQSRRTS